MWAFQVESFMHQHQMNNFFVLIVAEKEAGLLQRLLETMENEDKRVSI